MINKHSLITKLGYVLRENDSKVFIQFMRNTYFLETIEQQVTRQEASFEHLVQYAISRIRIRNEENALCFSIKEQNKAHENSSINYLMNESWTELHTRVGDCIIIELLLGTLLAKLGGTFLIIAGSLKSLQTVFYGAKRTVLPRIRNRYFPIRNPSFDSLAGDMKMGYVRRKKLESSLFFYTNRFSKCSSAMRNRSLIEHYVAGSKTSVSVETQAVKIESIHGLMCSFITSAFGKSVFGRRNWCLFKTKLGVWLCAKKNEFVPLSFILEGMSVRELLPKFMCRCLEKRTKVCKNLLYAVFSLLAAYVSRWFHVVSDSSGTPLYYTKEVWKRIVEVNLKVVNDLFEPSASLAPIGTLRLIPKGSTLRPVIDMSRFVVRVAEDGAQGRDSREQRQRIHRNSVNHRLRPLLALFTHLRRREFSVLGYKELHERLCVIRKSYQEEVEYVSFDIERCYDRIPTELLLQAVSELLTEEVYLLHIIKLARIQPRSMFQTISYLVAENQESVWDEVNASKKSLQKGIVFDCSRSLLLDKSTIMRELRDHITNCIVKFNRRVLRLRTGVPQGSVLSPILCSIYYSYLDRRVFNLRGCELIRYVDDFLLVSASREALRDCFKRFLDSYKEYGCVLNRNKITSSFRLEECDHKIEPKELFPYCGLLVNSTLGVRPVLVHSEGPFSIEKRIFDSRTKMLNVLKRNLHVLFTSECNNESSENRKRAFLHSVNLVARIGTKRKNTFRLIDELAKHCRVSEKDKKELLSGITKLHSARTK